MYISRHMTTDPITVPPTMLLPEARALLNEFHFRHLPVVDTKGELLGILSDRDLRSAYPSSILTNSERTLVYERVQETTVAEIMSTQCLSLGLQSTLDDALLFFDRDRPGALPVLDGNRVVGIFSIRDLNTAYRALFGVGEKGSVLIAIIDDRSPGFMTRLVTLLENEQIPVSRILRIHSEASGDIIYIRLNTFKIAAVLSLLAENSFQVKKQ